jgi:hypothetical protein
MAPVRSRCRAALSRRELAAAVALGLLSAAGCKPRKPYYAVDYYYIPF